MYSIIKVCMAFLFMLDIGGTKLSHKPPNLGLVHICEQY